MTNETLELLRKKASMLPKTPGVYIMKNQLNKVIYVGKSRSLRDRVSQYFHLSSDANIKTVRMVMQIYDFETIFCDTEIEALVLENIKIKQYAPKYNILLKDSKSYPYIKLTLNEEYPRLTMVRKRSADGAKYFGPYSSASVVYSIIETLEKAFRLPTCKRRFPADIGKERPCIYKQLNRCVAPCDSTIGQEEFYKIMKCASDVLRGNIKESIDNLSIQMQEYADAEKYESAARCRDQIEALKKLQSKQKVVGSPDDEYDIITTYSDDVSTCISVFYIRSGAIMDSDNYVFGAYEIANEGNGYEHMSNFIADLYIKMEFVPKEIYLGFEFDKDELELVEEYLKELSGHSVSIKIPQKGNMKKLCEMITKNSIEQTKIRKKEIEKDTKVLSKLAQLLSLDSIPTRIEAYDISNLGNEHITAGMIVYEEGKFLKSDYRVLKMKEQNCADDYLAMQSAIKRRLLHLNDATGSFSKTPDLILLDGGKTHVSVIKKLFEDMNISIPVYGMVKDEHHKTRTLITENEEISIAKEQSVFLLVYKIQEEVHRFSVSKMDTSKRKTLKKYFLEDIDGIGPKKARAVMHHFKTVDAVKKASIEELTSVKGITKKDAEKIFNYIRGKMHENNNRHS